MNNSIISIIVPNYNHAPFLEQRLESVFNQTFRDFEVILLDDASTDWSVEILKKYADHSKVSHFLVNKQNSGSPFKQWQKGINLAKGKYIWIAESDDYCELNFLELLLPLFKKNTVLVYCASNMLTTNGNINGLDPWATGKIDKRWLSSYCNSGKAEIEMYLRYNNTIPNTSAVVFRKEIALSTKIPVNMYFCGDWFFWIQILKKGNIAYLCKPINYFRSHDNSTRAVSEGENENRRFKEYFYLIKSLNPFLNRILNRRKYDWLINQWWSRRHLFSKSSIFQIGMPLDFLARYAKKKLESILYLKNSDEKKV